MKPKPLNMMTSRNMKPDENTYYTTTDIKEAVEHLKSQFPTNFEGTQAEINKTIIKLIDESFPDLKQR